MEEDVRLLHTDDCADVARLEAEARAAMVDQRGGPARLGEVPPVVDWTPLVGDPVRPVWVATFDDAVVGYLELELLAGVANVRQVYVHPEARELGFGDAMLAAALQIGREAGCAVVEGTALPGDRQTKNLYERAGITARKIVVSKPL